MTTDPSPGWRQDMAHVIRGLCMGCADVVPGVSGGTVALILGIYQRLVTAISRVDLELLRRLRAAAWRESVAYVDLRFLVFLAAGILLGIVGMTLAVNRLMSESFSRSLTLAAFFGMILASAIVVASLIRVYQRLQLVICAGLGLAAAAVAWWLTTLEHGSGEAADPSYPWLFACGSLAICAMILPGISGAMILLVLGVYEHLTEVPGNLLAGEQVGTSCLTLLVFGSGCAISLILFSKVLRWLLTVYHAPTMSLLCGFMFGALRKLWPFQRDVTPQIEEFKHKTFEPIWPEALDGRFAAVLITFLAAMALVFAVDWTIRRRGEQSAAPSPAGREPESS